MNMYPHFDIIIKYKKNLKELQDILKQLEDINIKGFSKIIICGEYEYQEEVEKLPTKGIPVLLASSESKLSELAIKDTFIICPDLVIGQKIFEKMASFAYSQDEIATVSPLIANINIKNEIENIDFERTWLPGRREINAFSQYCVFIKQDIIEIFGNYKLKEVFSCDFQMVLDETLKQLGRRQELCPQIVMFHKNLKQAYESDFGYPDIIDNIRMHKELKSEKKSILYVIQADFSRDASNNIGGTQLHVKDLVAGVRGEYRVIVAARDGEFLRVTVYMEEKPCIFKFYIGMPQERPIFYDASQRKIFKDIINIFSVDLVHIHHTYSFSMEIYEAAAQCKVPIITTLHDFYFLCPTIKMFDYNNQCCIGKETGDHCRKCLCELMGIAENIDYITYWRMHTYRYLQMCQKIIVPSENAKEIISRYLPQIADNIQIIEHGYDRSASAKKKSVITSKVHENVEIINQHGQCTEIRGWAYFEGKNNNSGKIYLEITDNSDNKILIPTYKTERADVAQGDCNNLKTGFVAFIPNNSELSGKNMKIQILVTIEGTNYSSGKKFNLDYIVEKKADNLRVAFIGGLSVAKGSRQIYDLIEKEIPGVDWYIFGGIDDEKLSKLQKENLTWTNFYQRDDLETYLNLHKIDIIVILSLWPETFCYTLSEAVAYKRPVIVTDVGALGARTREMKCGWTVSLNNIVPETQEILERVKKKPKEYEVLYEHVKNIQMRSLADMGQEYLLLYRTTILQASGKNISSYDTHQFYNAWQEKTLKQGETRVISKEEYEAYIVKLEREIENIRLSRSYRLARKIAAVWTTIKGKRS